ncbi:Ff.00g117970.m01.CDS01 [Fusarium sp. VM40]|nr:Ff.00g117970.m01.CDS01 [Fusarium sp. VM40]
MKFTLFSTLTLVNYVLSAPAVDNDIATRDEAKLNARRLPLPLPAYALPRIGVTVTSKGKSSTKCICRRSSAINRHENLVIGMGRVAEVIKARCNDIESALEATRGGTMTSDQAVQTGVNMMDNIRVMLFGTVSGLGDASNPDLAQEERKELIEYLYTINSYFYKTTKDFIDTLGGASGGRSLSRAGHMLAEMLESIATTYPSAASDMGSKLAPIFPAELGQNDDDLLDLVMGPVVSFLTSIKTVPVDDSKTAECSISEMDCSGDLNEDLR